MLCLVTGAAGFIASHLVEKLLAEGHQVRGIDCFTEYYSRALKERNLAEIRDHPVLSKEIDWLENASD